MRPIITVLLFFILFGIYSTNGQAATNDNSLIFLDNMADEALQLAKAERYEETKALIENFDSILNSGLNIQFVIAMDELRVLEMSYQEVTKILEKDEFTKDELVNSVLKFRLVVDAISTDYEPLWVEMESQVLTAFQSAKNAALKQDRTLFNSELNSFLSLYNIIYPSLSLDLGFEKIQKVDTQIQYISQYTDKVISTSKGIAEIETLGDNLQSLFEQTEEDEAEPGLWWVIISTWGIIISTLSYVGYRKYKGEKEAKRNYEKEHKD